MTVYEHVHLPHTWNQEDGNTGGNDYYRGKCYYKKVLNVSDDLKGQKLYLEFEGANSEAFVYVNEQYVGCHRGGFSTFRVAITDAIRYGEENIIVVSVDNSHIEEIYPLMADFTFYGGIYRSVHLVSVSNIHYDLMDIGSSGVYISQKAVSQESATIGIEAKVINEGLTKQFVTFKGIIRDEKNAEVETFEETAIVTEATTFFRDITIDQPHLWQSIEDPYLYQMTLQLYVDDVLVDERIVPTGLRYYSVDPEKGFMLNGVPTKLRGVSRHQDRADRGWALTQADQEDDMSLIKEMGANSIRLAHYQHNQYFYDLCDKTGMIIWAEIPFISKHSKTDATGENACSQMRELIRQNYNHSCICFWGVQNEITISGKNGRIEEIVQRLHDITHKEDPYRLTTMAQVGHLPDGDSMNEITDVLAYNKYFGWYYDEVDAFDNWLTQFKEQNPTLCLGISEYGAEGILKYHTETPKIKDYTEEYHALYHEKVLQIFNKHPQIWGTYVWNMFDFASDFRDEGGVQGMNNKGLVTHDRTIKKDAFYYYKASWSQEPFIHITSKRFRQRINKTMNVKVYSNLDALTISVNGEEVATVSGENHVFLFENIALTSGENVIRVFNSNNSDEAVFEQVQELTVNHECPEDGKSGIVSNWFDDSIELDENIEPLEFLEGYFSIKDTIENILENEEGEAILRKYLAPMFDHPMFDMTKGFNIEMLTSFDSDTFNEVLLYNINHELNKVKKPE